MSAPARAGQVFLVLLGLLNVVFSLSVYASAEDPFPQDANHLIATWGVGFGLLVIALATLGLSSRERWAWWALWVVPGFLAAHVALLGTWIPDAVLGALAVAALLATRPTAPTQQAGARASLTDRHASRLA